MISCENWWSLRWPHCSGSCRDHTAWEVTRVTRCYRLRSLWVPFDLSWFQSKQRLFSSFYETYVVWKSAHTPARTSTPPLNGKKRLYSWSWQCSFLPEWWAFPCCSLLANFAVVSACPALSACFPNLNVHTGLLSQKQSFGGTSYHQDAYFCTQHVNVFLCDQFFSNVNVWIVVSPSNKR